MFERFTDRSRRVVVLAQEEARLLHHNFIGTEHVLLGLVYEGEGVAAKVLAGFGFTLDFVRGQVEERGGRGTSIPTGHVPFTPRAKAALENGLREALDLGHNYIGTEHLLLGLLRDEDDMAVLILAEKVTPADLRAEVVRVLGTYEQAPAPPKPPAHSWDDAVFLCTAILDLVPTPRERAAVSAFLASWYGAKS